MALFKINKDQITGRGTHLFADKTTVLINGAGVYGLTVNDVTKSKFFYLLNLNDDTEGVVRIETTKTVTSVRNAVNKAYSSETISLTVYKEMNTSSDTETITYKSSDISLAYTFSGGSIVYIVQGVLLERIAVVETLDQIIAGSSVPTTTTTTWPGGINITAAVVQNGNRNLIRVVFDADWDGNTIDAQNAVLDVFSATHNGAPIDFTGVVYWESNGIFNIYLGGSGPVQVGDVLTVSYDHDAGGGSGWNDGAGNYVEDFTNYPVDNQVYTTTTTTSTSTSTTSTSSTSTSSTSTSSTSTSTTSTTTEEAYESEMFWDDGTCYFRMQVRSGSLNLDKKLTPLGWDGTAPGDWINIWSKTLGLTTTTTSTTTIDYVTIVNISVENATPNRVTIEFSEQIDTDTYQPIDFTFYADGGPIAFTGSTGTGDGITCTFVLSSSVSAGQVLTFDHTHSSHANSIYSADDGAPLTNYTGLSVTNNVQTTTSTTSTSSSSSTSTSTTTTTTI